LQNVIVRTASPLMRNTAETGGRSNYERGDANIEFNQFHSDSKSADGNIVGVRVPPNIQEYIYLNTNR